MWWSRTGSKTNTMRANWQRVYEFAALGRNSLGEGEQSAISKVAVA